MPMQLLVLSDQRLTSLADWQRAIDREDFPLRLCAQARLDQLNGIIPVELGDRQAELECTHCDARTVMDDHRDIQFGHSWRCALAVRWAAGSLYATPAAYMAAAAYAMATNGMLLDCEEGRLLAPARAADVARELHKNAPRMESGLRVILDRLNAPHRRLERASGRR